MAVVLLSTAFFHFLGIENWKILACIWALIPLVNVFYFTQVPIYPISAGHEKIHFGNLLKNKIFWILILMMVCSGASEHSMGQWASAFAESGLKVSKTVGDLAGPCAFALFMGTARALYRKYADYIPLKKMMIGSSILCIICYFLAILTRHPVLGLLGCALCGFSVGIFWPGTFSMAAIHLPGGGTAMYALMALAGDLGCSTGPTIVGFLANAKGGNLQLGLIAGLAFPILMLIGISQLKINSKTVS